MMAGVVLDCECWDWMINIVMLLLIVDLLKLQTLYRRAEGAGGNVR